MMNKIALAALSGLLAANLYSGATAAESKPLNLVSEVAA